jgi:hypothetical protein
MRSRRNEPTHDEAEFGLQLLEDELRTGRPVASAGLAASIADALDPRRTPKTSRRQLVFAATLTATLASALASVGGVSYAANAVTHAASVAKSVVVTRVHVVGRGVTAGGDQYRPGFGFGDPNHNHTGPPGLEKKGGEFAPPLTPKIVGTTAVISTSFTIDEQAHLFISVIDTKTGKQVVITQTKSKIGAKLKGKQAKTVNYLVLVPRTIPLNLAVPSKLLLPGHSYSIQVIARDPQGNKKTLQIPFSG